MSLCRKKNKTFDIAHRLCYAQAIAFLQDAVERSASKRCFTVMKLL
jgi:hypothetical protein